MIRIWATIGLMLLAQAPAVGLAAAGPIQAAPPFVQAVAQPVPAPSDPPTLTPSFRDAVYGNFVQAGNSVLRCPVEGEETGGLPAEDCVAATQNQTPGGTLDNRSNNNGYYLHAADDDGSDATFNSSRALLEIPAGAQVRYAQLHWGAHTGKFVGFSGANCIRPLLLQGQPPPPPAAVTPDLQQVTLAVAGRAPDTVPIVDDHFTLTTGLAEPSEVYTNWADVTSWFEDVPTGEEFEVSVGNVWAPTGPGCAGGWSLVVVFGYAEPTDGFPLRVVDLYTDDLPKGGMLMPGIIEPLVPGFPSQIDGLLPGLLPGVSGSAVILPGVNARRSSAGVEIGVTAYDGDWNQGADTLSVDGEPVTDPCLNDDTADDFFRSCGNGAIDPVDATRRPQNNMSVDSKTFRPELEDNDTGEIELRVDSVADFLVLQNVVLAESVEPGISVTNEGPTEPVEQGQLAEFQITVENTGSVPLYDIDLEVASDQEPATTPECTPASVQPLDPGESATVTCVEAAGFESFTNTARATATYLTPVGGGEPRTVTASDVAEVEVVQSDFAVQRVPDKLITHVGEPVTFTVVLFNNTGDTLTDLEYADEIDDSCGPTETELAGGSQVTFECVAADPQVTFDSAGTMTGTVGGTVVTKESARVVVTVIDPALTVGIEVDKDTIYEGDTVTLTFTVTNTGDPDNPDETVNDIGVTVDELPDCRPDRIESLAPGESAEVTCTVQPAETMSVEAVAEGSDLTDTPVTATSDPLRITVLQAPLAITQEADRTTVRVEDTQVTFTMTVTNTDDPEDADARTLHDVQIGNATIPNCQPQIIETLGPGESQSRTCTAGPDRTFDSVASATAYDAEERPMRVLSDPLRITVINPVMVITSSFHPAEAKHGASVQLRVTVRNIGDVPLVFEVTNDQVQDCDFTVTEEDGGLPASAAQGRTCMTLTPESDSEDEFVNVATFEALPTAAVGDDGEPITGEANATVNLLPGQAPPQPTPDPGSPGGGSSGGSPGGGSGGSGSDQGSGLPVTGASLVVPIVLGVSLLVAGAIMAVAARRPNEDDEGFLARWWPGN